MIKQYDTVRLRDGREGTVVEVLGGGERFLVDVGTSPQDWETIDVIRNHKLIKAFLLRQGRFFHANLPHPSGDQAGPQSVWKPR